MQSIVRKPTHLRQFNQFKKDAAAGTLPSFSWINPLFAANPITGEGANDQHPDHSIARGEHFLKDIYETLRKSPAWNETLLVITYDEHGGFWDHVPVPTVGVPAPDDVEASYPLENYTFDRLGVRIPTVLVSPLIPRGTVISAPPSAQKPAASSEYDLTSIMATARILLGMTDTEPLTTRDAWSATFEHVLSLETPRSDCPTELPDAPKPGDEWSLEAEMALPINELQRDILGSLSRAAGEERPAPLATQGEIAGHLRGLLPRVFERAHAHAAGAPERRDFEE